MTNTEKQLLVQRYQERPGRASLAESAERLREELEKELLSQGVPASLLTLLRAVQQERLSIHAVARSLFPVESLPDGALPIYDRDPEVAEIIADGTEERS